MRATDGDRDATSSIVAAAASDGRLTLEEMHERLERVFAARTHGDLAEITRDLVGASHTPARQPPRPLQPFSGTAGRSTSVTIFGGVERKGAWSVPGHLQLIAVMGGADIDFTDAVFQQAHTTINVIAIMGGVDITAPPHVRVESDVSGIMSGCDNRADDGPGQYVVRVTGLAIMGGVRIRRTKGDQRGQLWGPPAPPLPPPL